VGETVDFIKTGGMIRFVTQDKIRFEIKHRGGRAGEAQDQFQAAELRDPTGALAPYFPFRPKLTLIYPPNGTRLASNLGVTLLKHAGLNISSRS
jgi:hypothetical protein